MVGGEGGVGMGMTGVGFGRKPNGMTARGAERGMRVVISPLPSKY